MAPRIFVTGVSGFIGGQTVGRIVDQHPEWSLVLLVRSEEQKKAVSTHWPKLEVVIGDLDSKDLLVEEASKADVVLQIASSDHIPGPVALIEGLSRSQPKPGYFIHISGTGMLHDASSGYGNPSEKIYHDIADLTEVTSFPVEGHAHREVDAAVLAAHEQYKVPTAIVSPPMIYGIGSGPIKKWSIQVPYLIQAILKRGKAFSVLKGQNIWDLVHVDDVADAFILLIEEALKPNGGRAQWGSDGYYFAEAGEFKWGDISSEIAKLLQGQGLIKSSEVDQLSVEESSAFHPWASVLWGGNARSRADRLRRLGWKPKVAQLSENLAAMVAEEAKRTGQQTSKTTFDK